MPQQRRSAMTRSHGVVLLAIGLTVGAAVGYRYAHQAPSFADSASALQAAAQSSDRKILYYRDPSGAPYWSAAPKKDDQGRDYLPVYDDEPSSAASKPATRSSSAGSKRVRYYRNPMGLPDTSPVPKKDSMGMDYIPVYEGDDQDDDNTVKVSLDRIQRSGVRIEKVQLRTVVRAIRAPGVVRINERKLSRS